MADEKFDRKYDIVVFGATGFTGQFVVEEIARTIDGENDLKWAIAGRNMRKMQNVLSTASSKTGKDLEELPILIADTKVHKSLIDMAQQAKVVLNCVGPYRFHGDQMVRACIEGGASHLDISGEPEFLEKVALLYNKKAQEAGIYLIGACGFDSIPADMGVLYTKQKFDGDLNTVEGYLSVNGGEEGFGINFATYQSAIHGFANAKATVLQRKQLMGGVKMPAYSHKLQKRGQVFHSDAVDGYCIPFPGSDRSIVNRTQAYIYTENKQRPIQFTAYARIPSLFYTVMAVVFGSIFGALASFGIGRYILETFPGLFTFGMVSNKGPSSKQIKGTSFSYTFFGSGYASKLEDPSAQHEEKPDKQIVTKVTGPEPGYVTTPICLVQAAYTLLNEEESLPESGGVFTTGAAFAKTKLIDRLLKSNIMFSVVEQ